MEEIDRLSIIKCKDVLMHDLDPNNHFLYSLYTSGAITDSHKSAIQAEDSQRNKTALLLQILPTRGPKAFNKFVTQLNKDHSWLTQKILKAKKSIQNQQNQNNFMNVIDTMSILVFGKKRTLISKSNYSEEKAIGTMQKLVEMLKDNCLTALGGSKDPNITTGSSLSQIIRKKNEELETEIEEGRAKVMSLETKLKSLMEAELDNSSARQLPHQKKDPLKFKADDTKKENMSNPYTEISKLKMKLRKYHAEKQNLEKEVKAKDKKLEKLRNDLKHLKKESHSVPIPKSAPVYYKPQLLPWD